MQHARFYLMSNRSITGSFCLQVLALECSIGGEPPVSCCRWWSPQTPSLPNSCQMVLFSSSLQIGIPLCLITIQTLQNLWHHLPHSMPVLQKWPIHSVAPALCNPVCQWRRSWFVEVLAWICQHNPHALLFHMLQDHGCRYGWRTMHIHQQCIMGDIILTPSQEVLTFWWCWTGVKFIFIGFLKVDVDFLTPWSCSSSESRSSRVHIPEFKHSHE